MNVYYVGKPLKNRNFKQVTIEECIKYLKNQDCLGLDIETTAKYKGLYDNKFKSKWGSQTTNPNKEGLDPYLSKIVMLQIGDLERQYIIDVRVNDITVLKPILEDKNIQLVGHNIKFEYKHLLNYNIKINNVYDTMIVDQILFNGLSNYTFSLNDLNKRYLNIKVDKTIREEFYNIGDKEFSTAQIKYGAEDIINPLKIKYYQEKDAIKKDVINCISLEMLFIPTIGDIEYKGMYFNQQQWLKTYDANKLVFDQRQSELDNYVLFKHSDSKFIERQLDLFSTELKCNIKWTSSKQVIEFFKYLNICPQKVSKTTKKLSYTVKADIVRAHLVNIENKEYKEFAIKYLKFKESEQAVTTFGTKFFKYINPITNRLHSNYKQILNTGRISSSSPNLQNIPSDLNFRKAFDSPEGWNIVNADYSGQEQVILANKSEDVDLQSFYLNGYTDMHSFIASKIYPELNKLSLDEIKANHKDKRQIAKAAGFAINYGGTGYTIAENLGIPESQGDEVYNSYFKAFPGLKNYFTKVQNEALKRGYILIDPITGRKNWFNKPLDHKDINKIKKNALNYPIQGEAGAITKLAPILFRKWILNNKLEDVVFITNLVHDEINIEVREDYAEKAARALEICMKKAADRWCKTIKLSADAVITKYWTH